MANEGAVCIVPSGYFPWNKAPAGDETDFESIKTQINLMKAALLVLINQEQTDNTRLAVIGHDYGAMHAMALIASVKAFSTAVFMTPVDEYAQWNRIIQQVSAEKYDAYKTMLMPLAPVTTLKYNADTSILFQFVTIDQFVSAAI